MRLVRVMICAMAIVAAVPVARAERAVATAPIASVAPGPPEAPEMPVVRDAADIADASDQQDGIFGGWVILPGMWFSTDQGLGVSAMALTYLPLEEGDQRASELALIGSLTTQGDNVLRAEPTLYLRDRTYRLDARLEVARRSGSYFGMGNDAALAAEERYRRFRVASRASIARRVLDDVYLGLAWDAYWSSELETDAGGMLSSGQVLGAAGGFVVGLGLVARRDTRNRTYAPSSGALVELGAYVYDGALGSDYGFATLQADARTYLEVAPEHVVALHARGDFRAGAPPFDRLPTAGGSRLLRGIRSGRFRDHQFVGAQIEYRSPMWWRVGGVLFAATGRVAEMLTELAAPGWKLAGGGGLRFAIKRGDRVNVRLDAGFAADGYEIYVDIREAF